MLRFLAETYGTMDFGIAFGHIFGFIVGLVFALLLLSAVNTAIAALIGLLFMMSREGDMPRSFAQLNTHGVPLIPLAIAVGLPMVVLLVTDNFEALAGLYAIGVVGAICVNLGSCSFNMKIEMHWVERVTMLATFLILIAVELTLAKTKHEALFFVICVLVVGLFLWAYSQRLSGTRTLTVTKEFADIVKPEVVEQMSQISDGTEKILVCVRGLTPVLRFAFDEAKLRDASLYVLYIREIAVLYTGGVGAGSELEGGSRGKRDSRHRNSNWKASRGGDDPIVRERSERRINHCGYGGDARDRFPDVGGYASRGNEQVAARKRRLRGSFESSR